ncbi:DUF2950 domain-containing protein [Pseudoxanthomonas koreensis]|uniref:DUF2950 domain-containing protein n=1 Tax=Pseudoxanthomonas koreensis TaxID=266061 RepID=UPI0013908688|nr:DUF2950 domain-containing protein [Pseudoxanthomonas koreensis]KAF1690645.1 hypothetical protein CSC64_11155 [Pseudoxanthomonas koreensis]
MKRFALSLALAALFAPAASAAEQAFPSAEAAAAALVDALGTTQADAARLAALFGKDGKDYVPADVDRADVDAFLADYRKSHRIDTRADGSAVLAVGDGGWTFPAPLRKQADGWRFDMQAGRTEMRARLIGRNELATLQSTRAYHDAQVEYALQDHDGDGVLEYAHKLISSDGLHDGLYWSDDDSGDISPLGPLFADATPGSDWHGYHYRILDAQGPSAPGGAFSYLLGDDMSRGFALLAWPAKYGETGVMTFMISHDGEVFEKDIGPSTAKVAGTIKAFDPDDSWKDVGGDLAGP